MVLRSGTESSRSAEGLPGPVALFGSRNELARKVADLEAKLVAMAIKLEACPTRNEMDATARELERSIKGWVAVRGRGSRPVIDDNDSQAVPAVGGWR